MGGVCGTLDTAGKLAVILERQDEREKDDCLHDGARGGYLGGNYTKNVSQTLTAIHAGHNAMAIITENSVTEDVKMEETKTFDARGNGDGDTVNTLTGDHADRVTDYTPVVFQQNQRDEVREMEVPGALQAEPGMKQQNFVAVLDGDKINKKERKGGSGLGVGDRLGAHAETAKDMHIVCVEEASPRREVYTIDSYEGNSMKSSNPHSGIHMADVAKTLDTTIPGPSKNQGGQMICETAAIGFNPGQSKDGGLGLEEGVSPNIRANSSANDPAVAIAENIIGRKPENGGHQLGVNDTGAAYTQEAMSPHGVCHNATVRRLLPVETERLQGMPDFHTVPCFRPEDITDELVERFVEIHYEWSKMENGDKAKRKSAKQVRDWLEKISNPDTCPDAPRYKAVGNSMAVNCMEWLGRRIQMVEDRIQREEKGHKENEK